MVDRGKQSKEVLEYIYNLHKLDKAIVILGNHDQFLINFFEGDFSRVLFNMELNGHKKTIDSLCEYEVPFTEELEEQRKQVQKEYPHIYNFLKSLKPFYELDKYIFVHGGIDTSLDDWRQDSIRNFIWSKQHLLSPLENKIIVVGHVQAVRVRTKVKDIKKLYKASPELFDILYGEETIHIDGSVHTTKNINVLILDI